MNMEDPSKKTSDMAPTDPGGTAPAPYPTQAGYPLQPSHDSGGFVPPPGQPKAYTPQKPIMAMFVDPPTKNQGNVSGGFDWDVESGAGNDPPVPRFNAFSDKAVRLGFIRKVYSILAVQLLITMAFIMLFLFVDPVKLYVKRNKWLVWTAFGIMLTFVLIMACFQSARRRAPLNFIFLGIFTAAEGFLLGNLTAYFDVESVLIAVGVTAVVTVAVTLFAFQTKYDFTKYGGILLVLLIVFIIAVILIPIWYNKFAIIAYGVVGALIFSMFIVFDTQLMLGGKHKYALDPEDYVFAALNLYLDIINIFTYILMAAGAGSD